MSMHEIPKTDSIQELAHFWDTHDVTDFEDQLEEVSDPVFQRETVVEIRLQPGEVSVLKQIAESKGVRYPDLIREWIQEKVHSL